MPSGSAKPAPQHDCEAKPALQHDCEARPAPQHDCEEQTAPQHDGVAKPTPQHDCEAAPTLHTVQVQGDAATKCAGVYSSTSLNSGVRDERIIPPRGCDDVSGKASVAQGLGRRPLVNDESLRRHCGHNKSDFQDERIMLALGAMTDCSTPLAR